MLLIWNKLLCKVRNLGEGCIITRERGIVEMQCYAWQTFVIVHATDYEQRARRTSTALWNEIL